jgi:hypothetical protein
MAETRQTTIRFGETLYQRMELASDRTGLPINSIVVIACMEWLKQNEPDLAYRRNFSYPSQPPRTTEQE